MAANDDIATQAAEDAAAALAEDIGAGDLSRALADSDSPCGGVLYCRENAVLCGRQWFEESFLQLDSAARFVWHCGEGEEMRADAAVCEVSAIPAALFAGERAAINFLQTLSATATAARRFCRLANGATITDTRKTIPKLRAAQKYAARIGGAKNHRRGLFDEILIKENHLALCGGIKNALTRANRIAPPERIQIEARSLDDVAAAIAAGATRVLLDNFSPDDLRQAVCKFGARAELEASGGIDEKTIAEVAATGVHRISLGAITKNIRAVDFSFLVSANSREHEKIPRK